MMDAAGTVFDPAAVYNRRFPGYMKSCARPERGIRYPGSCCLTKAAPEAKDHPPPARKHWTGSGASGSAPEDPARLIIKAIRAVRGRQRAKKLDEKSAALRVARRKR